MHLISPNYSPAKVQPVRYYPDPGWVLIKSKSGVERAYQKETPPFLLLGLMLRVLWKQFYSNFIFVPALVFSHPLLLPWVGATDFSPPWAVTSLSPSLIWGISLRGWWCVFSYTVGTPKQSQGNQQQLQPAAPALRSAAAEWCRRPAISWELNIISRREARWGGGKISLVDRMWVPEKQSNFILTFSPSSFPFQMHIRFYFTWVRNALLTAEITNLIWNWDF